jgi:NTP pyrophosphatase (non-canonical NTP hydrolase)
MQLSQKNIEEKKEKNIRSDYKGVWRMSNSEQHKELMRELLEFVDSKDWDQYHNLKDLSVSISIEAAELLENFQWKSDADSVDKEELQQELADIMIYCFLMCNKLSVDPIEIMKSKLEKNKLRKFKV